MINEETIKSLYNDKPTLMEWLKRTEELLEELKRGLTTKELNADNAKFANLEINGKFNYSGSELKGVQPTLTGHYVRLKDVSNNQVISAIFIFRKSAKFTSMDDFFNALSVEYDFIPSNLAFFGTGFIYTITIINSTMITARGFNMVNASAVINPNIAFLEDTIFPMGDK